LRGTNKTLAPTPGFIRPTTPFPTEMFSPPPSPGGGTPPPSPAPTRCEEQQFWFDGNECTNADFPDDSFFGYASLDACCNAEFGPGSRNNGNCEYTDFCGEPSMSMDYILESFGKSTIVI
jgi:hypothetical protein